MARAAPGTPGKIGAPSRLTPAMRKKICDLIRQGRSATAAGETAGVSASAIASWRAKAREGGEKNKIYVEFEAAVQEALEAFEQVHLARIAGGDDGTVVVRKKHVVREGGQVVREEAWEEHKPQPWTASAWLLQKVHPARYSEKHMVEHSGAVRVEAEIKPFSAWASEEGIDVPEGGDGEGEDESGAA